MAIQKRKHAPKRKLFRRKRLARRPQRTLVNRALHPIPQRYITKMKYSETITTDAVGQYQFNLNSIFDPNRTGTGHQPYGHDTLATLYNRYRVISCGYRVQYMSRIGGIPVTITAMPGNEVVLFGTASEARENPRCKYVAQSAQAPIVTLTGKSYIPSLVGRTKAQYMADDRYQAVMGASPQEFAILNLGTYLDTDVPQAVTLQVLLEFTVEFFDIKHLAQS